MQNSSRQHPITTIALTKVWGSFLNERKFDQLQCNHDYANFIFGSSELKTCNIKTRQKFKSVVVAT